MQLRVFTEPQQGATYADLLAVARATEEHGFDAFFRSDHYLKMGDVPGLPGPSDAWVTLGALARETTRIRLGTLVTAATFRLPGPLAISVAGVDEMSAGRVELGIGAGWYDDEHRAYGIPFPPTKERFERFEEQLAILTGLWSTQVGSRFSFDGRHYQLSDSPALPKPVQHDLVSGGAPIIIGGYGARTTPRLAARFAAEFNVPFGPLEVSRDQFDKVRGACEAAGRDPSSVVFSVAQVVCCGATDDEIARRAKSIGRDVDELRKNGMCGTPAEVVERVQEFAAAGATRTYLQVLDLADLDHLALLGTEVLPHV